MNSLRSLTKFVKPRIIWSRWDYIFELFTVALMAAGNPRIKKSQLGEYFFGDQKLSPTIVVIELINETLNTHALMLL
jgi:hypothetical protein